MGAYAALLGCRSPGGHAVVAESPRTAGAGAAGEPADRTAVEKPIVREGVLVGRPLHRAAGAGDIKEVERLLTLGAVVDAAGWNGMTALMEAARRGQVAVVRVLLVRGADLGRTDSDGRTALVWSALLGREDVALALLEAGVPAQIPDAFERTAESYARERNHQGVLRALAAARVKREGQRRKK